MVIAIAFLFITQPVAGHLIGRAAYMTGIKVAEETVRDDMGSAIEKRRNNQQEELENE